MRHLLLVRTLAGRMREPTILTGLVAPSCLEQGLSACSVSAVDRAVTVSTVAETADEEHLAALRPITDDEAK